MDRYAPGLGAAAHCPGRACRAAGRSPHTYVPDENMGRIQSNIGLITGVPITDTVNQLMAISAQPRDRLIERTAGLKAEQVAIAELTAVVLGVELAAKGLGKSETFSDLRVGSSNSELLSANVTGSPAAGDYQFTPLRRAQNHQLLSRGVASLTDPLGAGEFRFQFGGRVDSGLSLDRLNGGDGIQRGKIRITDRSGASEVIDLRFAQTIDDVLAAVNSAETINVSLEAVGDRLRLSDHTGGAGNLKVQQFGGGTTASDLGLGGIDVAADSAVGQDVLSLHEGLSLDLLNDGSGVRLDRAVADLQITLRDGSTLEIDLDRPALPEGNATATTAAANGADAQVVFTAAETGGDFDDVTIVFQANPGVSKGAETVVYDDTDPQNKTLTFQISNTPGDESTAADIVAALAGDPTASQVFTAAIDPAGDGTGVIDPTDTAVTAGGAAVAASNETTLGDLLDTINQADPAKLEARIAASGDAIELVDLTSGGGSFTVANLSGGSLVDDLGLTAAAVGGVITGGRIQGGLKAPLLSSLGGGGGLGQLGLLNVTDRAGGSDQIDLSSAQTLDEVIDLINGSSAEITARFNSARHGIELVDTSGGGGDLTVANNADGLLTADKLRIAFSGAADLVSGGSLDLQVVGHQTRLDSLAGGKGVDAGSFTITDSAGAVGAVNLSVIQAKTVGHVIDEINGLGIGVTARINDTGDGILLEDTAGGAGQLTVADVGNGTAAADLRLTGTAEAGQIDGSTAFRYTVAADDTLQDLIDRINESDAGVAASVLNDGSSTPFRLSLVSQVSGRAGELVVDGGGVGLEFTELAAAQDAALLVGSLDSVGAGLLVTTATNDFEQVLDGVTLTVGGASTTPVTVSVESSDEALTSAANLFVSQYNKLRDKLDELTFFDEIEGSTGILFGSSEVLRVESSLSNLLSGAFFGAGSIQSLGALGFEFGEDGKLSLNADRLQSQYAADPDSVEQFFTAEDLGLVAKIEAVTEQLAGEDNSLLLNRNVALQDKIDTSDAQVATLNERLDRERQLLLLQFFQMESAIARLQNNLTALNSLQVIPPLSVGGSSA